MTPAERLQAFKDILDAIFRVANYPNIGEAHLAIVKKQVEAIAPIISGELVVVPVEPTEEMVLAARDTLPGQFDICNADIEDIYLALINNP